jgi:hypothetical protein
MRRRQLADSSLGEYEPTDAETDYYSDSETEFTSVDDDVDEVNVVDNVDEFNVDEFNVKDVREAKEKFDYVYLFANEIHLTRILSQTNKGVRRVQLYNGGL